jgi:hypothetical protein
MAVFTQQDLQYVRSAVAATGLTVTYTKATLDAATQAVEDWFAANQASLGAAINAATSPVVLSVAQKKALVVGWLLAKFNRGGN